MTTELPVLCKSCVHHNGFGTCEAFPDGIPDAILMDGADHRSPLRGDHGIQFEPKDTPEAKENLQFWHKYVLPGLGS